MNYSNLQQPQQPQQPFNTANILPNTGRLSPDNLNVAPIKIRASGRRRGNLLIDLPIGARLILGFLTAAVIAALVSGTIGFQHAQTAGQQTDFYKSLLQTNSNLTTGAQYLQIIKEQVQNTINDMSAQQPSIETLNQDKQSLNNLITLYDKLLTNYLSQDLLTEHPEQQSVLATAGRSNQIQQQNTLAASASRTWTTQKSALQAIIQDFNTNNLSAARSLQQMQVDPTNADALSAIRSLNQFNNRLADSVAQAEQVEAQREIITTIIGSIIAFIFIILVGLLISGTIIRRLRQLREVTQAVEQGQLDRRALVIGRDEIGDVSASVNAMLDSIGELLQKERTLLIELQREKALLLARNYELSLRERARQRRMREQS
jgi:HAMP domain-containing protein